MKVLRSAALAVAAVLLALHLALGIAALTLLPRGFSATDIHAWSNTVVPACAVLVTAAALVRYFFLRSSPSAVAALVAAAAGGWTFAVGLGVALFPVSLPISRALAPGAVALVLLAVASLASQRVWISVLAVLAGGGLGSVEVLAQRAPEPTTRPSGGTLAEVRGPGSSEEATAGQIIFPCGKGKLRVSPLLSFHSRSPDRTWTLLAPATEMGSRRSLAHYAKTANGFRAAYTDDGESSLVAARDKSGALDIEAVTKLPSPVYSHLGSFTVVHVTFDATVAFGPTGATRFPIEPADYPSGRPAKLAYLGDDLALHVVRARDAEKGPFTELAAGKLGRDAPLAVEIHPQGDTDKGCRLVFKDWSSQVSTAPSPTAGWGLPQNSIQFFATKDGEGMVLLTLAETGPGRGYDSVGHAAGTYRNRLRIEAIR